MSDGSLSQDEIDALLQGDAGIGFGSPQTVVKDSQGVSQSSLSALQDLLGSAVPTLSSRLKGVLGDSVSLGSPTVEMVGSTTLGQLFPSGGVEISCDFQSGIPGKHAFLMERETATKVSSLMMGLDSASIDDAAIAALGEAGTALGAEIATVMEDSSRAPVSCFPGAAREFQGGNYSFGVGDAVKVEYPLNIGGSAPARLIELFESSALESLFSGGDDMNLGSELAGFELGGEATPPRTTPSPSFGGSPSDTDGDVMSSLFSQSPSVQQVQYPSLNQQSGSGGQGNIGLLMDVYMEMTVELGRTKRLIKDILGMGEGTIVELDKLAGEPVDILVNHKLIAKGEVVVIDENFGVRVTEIVSPVDQMEDFT